MAQKLGSIALVVRDYDEAIAFYTNKLEFQLIEDTDLGNAKRWVQVRPPGSAGTDLLLARAVNPEQASRIGNQTGGRVFLFLAHRRLLARLSGNDRKRSEVRPPALARNRTEPWRSLRISTATSGICCN
jgi:catechol 2,3-dioxygenase-like lactoylglutathione lyase family enzyme